VVFGAVLLLIVFGCLDPLEGALFTLLFFDKTTGVLEDFLIFVLSVFIFIPFISLKGSVISFIVFFRVLVIALSELVCL